MSLKRISKNRLFQLNRIATGLLAFAKPGEMSRKVADGIWTDPLGRELHRAVTEQVDPTETTLIRVKKEPLKVNQGGERVDNPKAWREKITTPYRTIGGGRYVNDGQKGVLPLVHVKKKGIAAAGLGWQRPAVDESHFPKEKVLSKKRVKKALIDIEVAHRDPQYPARLAEAANQDANARASAKASGGRYKGNRILVNGQPKVLTHVQALAYTNPAANAVSILSRANAKHLEEKIKAARRAIAAETIINRNLIREIKKQTGSWSPAKVGIGGGKYDSEKAKGRVSYDMTPDERERFKEARKKYDIADRRSTAEGFKVYKNQAKNIEKRLLARGVKSRLSGKTNPPLSVAEATARAGDAIEGLNTVSGSADKYVTATRAQALGIKPESFNRLREKLNYLKNPSNVPEYKEAVAEKTRARIPWNGGTRRTPFNPAAAAEALASKATVRTDLRSFPIFRKLGIAAGVVGGGVLASKMLGGKKKEEQKMLMSARGTMFQFAGKGKKAFIEAAKGVAKKVKTGKIVKKKAAAPVERRRKVILTKEEIAKRESEEMAKAERAAKGLGPDAAPEHEAGIQSVDHTQHGLVNVDEALRAANAKRRQALPDDAPNSLAPNATTYRDQLEAREQSLSYERARVADLEKQIKNAKDPIYRKSVDDAYITAKTHAESEIAKVKKESEETVNRVFKKRGKEIDEAKASAVEPLKKQHAAEMYGEQSRRYRHVAIGTGAGFVGGAYLGSSAMREVDQNKSKQKQLRFERGDYDDAKRMAISSAITGAAGGGIVASLHRPRDGKALRGVAGVNSAKKAMEAAPAPLRKQFNRIGKASFKAGAALGGAGLAASLIGSKILGRPKKSDKASATKSGALGGVIVGGLGGATVGALAGMLNKDTKSKVVRKAGSFVRRNRAWLPIAAMGKGGALRRAIIGGTVGALVGGVQMADEGQQADTIRNLKRTTQLSSKLKSINFSMLRAVGKGALDGLKKAVLIPAPFAAEVGAVVGGARAAMKYKTQMRELKDARAFMRAGKRSDWVTRDPDLRPIEVDRTGQKTIIRRVGEIRQSAKGRVIRFEEDEMSTSSKLKRAAVGLMGGLMVVGNAKEAAGLKTVYHGTSAANADNIRKVGIHPRFGGGDTGASARPEAHGQGHLSPEEVAKQRKQFMADSRGKIHVTGSRGLASVFSGPSGEIVKATISQKDWERMSPDFDGGAGFSKETSATSRKRIPIEQIHGSSAPLRDRMVRTIKDARRGFLRGNSKNALGAIGVGGAMIAGAALWPHKKDSRQQSLSSLTRLIRFAEAPLSGKLAADRYRKKIQDEDLDRRDANIMRTALAGAALGGLLKGRRGAAAGAGAGALLVPLIRTRTEAGKDMYGERTREGKRAEGIPWKAAALGAGALAAHKGINRVRGIANRFNVGAKNAGKAAKMAGLVGGGLIAANLLMNSKTKTIRFREEDEISDSEWARAVTRTQPGVPSEWRKAKSIANNAIVAGKRGTRLTKDVIRSIKGEKNVDSRGRERQPEWKKPWVTNAATAAILGVGALGFRKIIKGTAEGGSVQGFRKRLQDGSIGALAADKFPRITKVARYLQGKASGAVDEAASAAEHSGVFGYINRKADEVKAKMAAEKGGDVVEAITDETKKQLLKKESKRAGKIAALHEVVKASSKIQPINFISNIDEEPRIEVGMLPKSARKYYERTGKIPSHIEIRKEGDRIAYISRREREKQPFSKSKEADTLRSRAGMMAAFLAGTYGGAILSKGGTGSVMRGAPGPSGAPAFVKKAVGMSSVTKDLIALSSMLDEVL